MTPLDAALRRASPRFHPRPIPPAGVAIVAAIAAFWVAAFYAAFALGGLSAWAFGVAFLVYDVAQLGFVGIQAAKLFRPPAARRAGAAPSVGVIVAAYNEAGALAATLDALTAQTSPPDEIWLADDGSDDDTAAALESRYGLRGSLGGPSAPCPAAPSLRWLRLPHRGKAHALNAALPHVRCEVVLTVDADTLLAPDAIAEIRRAFAEDPDLIVGGGVLEPRCRGGALGAALQAFQRLEYVRNFLARFAWSELDALLLISGAFAAFRTEALREVGGFDPASLVEDYELVHRLHRRARETGRPAAIRIVGSAFATTDAPATIAAFLNQRRRWFAGSIQTQAWNRDMIGARRFGWLGLAMNPVKCFDHAAPLYGLSAYAALVLFALAGHGGVAWPAAGAVAARIAFEFANTAYSIEAYRRWTGGRAQRRLALALACVAIEPFGFQALRHLGAARGWAALIAGRMEWGRVSRGAPSEEIAPGGEAG